MKLLEQQSIPKILAFWTLRNQTEDT